MNYFPPNRDKALIVLRPNAHYHWKGESFEGLVFKNEADSVTEKELQEQIKIEDKKTSDTAYKTLRKDAFNKAGLTFEYWSEINIEENQEAIDKYRSERNKIRLEIQSGI